MTGDLLFKVRCTAKAVKVRVEHNPLSMVVYSINRNNILGVYGVYNKKWYQTSSGLWFYGKYFEIPAANHGCEECLHYDMGCKIRWQSIPEDCPSDALKKMRKVIDNHFDDFLVIHDW